MFKVQDQVKNSKKSFTAQNVHFFSFFLISFGFCGNSK